MARLSNAPATPPAMDLPPPRAQVRVGAMMTGRFNRVRGALAALFLALGGAGPAVAADLTVFAAASLGTALEDVADAWRAETGGDLTLVLAGSSALARQVQAGAPADVVILANTDWMDMLEDAGRIVPETRRDLLGNTLVVIGGWHERDPLDLSDPEAVLARLGRGRLALALVDAVPAGLYARAALEHFGLWERVAPQVVQTDNVRATLALVATRAAHLGMVYATDAAIEPRVAVIADVPAEAHPPIRYPGAVVSGAAPDAGALLSFLDAPLARAIFVGHGFALAADP